MRLEIAMPNDKPYLDDNGDLVIPFACPDNAFKYWKPEGMKMLKLLHGLGASDEVLLRYLPRLPTPEDLKKLEDEG
ncbi:hypothetical protein [Paucidesulfovibrio longus]|uniref:hypothetical protein n=1 Tax=Paucidesulfovibrio longus TaxID=889 RepID=UPI00040EED66|nr:hypothetical protein [Paucidesulfovibrio longus]